MIEKNIRSNWDDLGNLMKEAPFDMSLEEGEDFDGLRLEAGGGLSCAARQMLVEAGDSTCLLWRVEDNTMSLKTVKIMNVSL